MSSRGATSDAGPHPPGLRPPDGARSISPILQHDVERARFPCRRHHREAAARPPTANRPALLERGLLRSPLEEEVL